MDDTFDIGNTTHGSLPRLPFRDMKESVLGKHYSLSLVFIGTHRSKKLNAQFKNKQTPASVLSFPLSDTEGEIFITPQKARTQAKAFGKTYEQHIGYLFIHGLLHLKGMEHGSTMDKAEQRLCQKFGV